MSKSPPPAPPEQRSNKGPGDQKSAPLSQGAGGSNTQNPDKIGHQGNTKINTTNQGYQQDR